MKLYRTQLSLNSASLSQWQSDTIFGHLCWSLVRRHNELKLLELLALYDQQTPPVLVSDGFAGGFLPRPFLPPKDSGQPAAALRSKTDRVKQKFLQKHIAQRQWLTLPQFERLRNGLEPEEWPTSAAISAAFTHRLQPKNQINRLTGTTSGEAGQLYELTELLIPQVTLYWKIADGWENVVTEFLEDLKMTGFGKRKTIGYGQIAECSGLESFDGFGTVGDANGFVTLSRFVPAPNDPSEGFWETTVKYGKLGEELATSDQPFKKPVIQLSCGSCFRDAQPREWYGRMLKDLAANQNIRQYAFAFALPIKFMA